MKFDFFSESQIIIIYSSFSAGCDNSLIGDNHHFCILGKEKVKHCIWLVNSFLMNKNSNFVVFFLCCCFMSAVECYGHLGS